ncbi:hypothetical protein IJG98_03615 [Candidatus Saccharibacteria bacterium]|nr:hypothetical protein [Candidatus Saccharibacteria bacterium]
MSKLTIKLKTLIAIIATTLFAFLPAASTYAIGQFAISPMFQQITLTPGETYSGNFEVINPGDNTIDFRYTVRVEPFSVEGLDNLSFTANGSYNQIVDWIELSREEGIISPNETQEVRFSIHVPEDAPAGGQYAAIMVTSEEYRLDNSTVDLREKYEASHLLYTEVAGETVRKGKIDNVNVPSFLLSGNIAGSATITNEGNVHSQATHTMQIFPLFSSEEVYTNEENPKAAWIMPGNTAYTSVSWDETPSVGIFHVIYNVEYEGVESKVDKIVIVCPLWLLFLILLAIFLIIFRILSAKKRSTKD